MMEKYTVSFRLEKTIKEKIDRIAEIECRDFSKQVIWILKQYISQAEKDQLLP